MKANEMPKKIYLFDYNDAMVTPIEGDTVYVREDAFIENAVEWLEVHLYDYWSQKITDYRDFTDEFRKYMKGEEV